MSLHDEEEDHDRQSRQCRPSHEPTPIGSVLGGERGEPDGERLLRVGAQEHVGDDVLVPCLDEAVDGRGDEARRDEREHYAHKRADARGAVDHRRLLEVHRHVGDEPAQRPDHEREHYRQVVGDDAKQAVDLADAVEQQVDRDDQRVERDHLDGDDITTNAVRPRKPKRATETAARNASAMEMATTERTTVRLLTTSFQKNGWLIAVRKLSSVTFDGNHTGVRLKMSLPGLSAVETIQ